MGLIDREVPSLSKPITWSQMTWSFYLRSSVLILRNNLSGEWKSLLSFWLVKFLCTWCFTALEGRSRRVFFLSWCWPAGGISLPLGCKGWCSQLLYLWVSGGQAATFSFLNSQSAGSPACCSCPVTPYFYKGHATQALQAGCSAVCCQLDPLIINFHWK